MRAGQRMGAAAGVAVVIAMATVALASEPDWIQEIGRLLDDARSDLDGVAGRSSVSEIDSAIGRAAKVKELAEKLRALPATTDDGKTMASSYPDWVGRFTESARALREMKQAQLKQVELRLTERCNEAQLRLRAAFAKLIEAKDPAGVRLVPDQAEAAAGQVRDDLRRVDDMHREIERWKGTARGFSESHGRWSGVRGKLHDGAEAIWDAWKRRHEETHYKCDDLVKGKDNPLAQDALKQLVSSDDLRKALLRDIDEHLRGAAGSLDRVFGDSSSGYVDDAMTKLDRVKDLLGRLQQAKGEDDQAKRVADRWPGLTDRAKQASWHLRELKRAQTLADRAPDRCRERVEERGSALSKSHKGAGREASELARQIGQDLRGRLETMDRQSAEMKRLHGKVREFGERDGAWDGVSSKLASAADAIEQYWSKAATTAHDKCDDAAKGERADRFVDKLEGKCTKNEQKELDKPVDSFCKRERSCNRVSTGDCTKLREYLKLNEQCADARRELNTWCYDGGDSGHQTAISNAETSKAECARRIAEECK